MKTHKYARKPFYVDAARVTAQNMEEMAEWCGGTIKRDEKGTSFIEVDVDRPRTERQRQAYVGDWVLLANGNFKVYVPKAFDRSFERARTFTKEQADAAGIKVPHEARTTPKKKQAPKPQAPRRPQQPPANPVMTPEQAAKLRGEEPMTIEVGAEEKHVTSLPQEEQEEARRAFQAEQEKKLLG